MPLAAAYVLADTAYAGTAELSDRVEVRVRDTSGAVGVDLVDLPAARIDITNRRWEYLLDYRVNAMLPDLQLGVSPQLLQMGDLGVSWRDRRIRVGITEYASYGQQNSAYLLVGTPAAAAPAPTVTPVGGGPQLLAQPQTLLYGSSRTVLASQFVLSRRWSGTASIEYSMQGGLDASSRAYLPFVMGPRADASATYALTPIDNLQTRASALESSATSALCSPAALDVPAGSECDPSAAEGIVTGTWQHHLSRTWTSALAAGAAYVRVRLRDAQAYGQYVYPVGTASIERATGPEEKRSVIHAEALVAPVLDVRSGLLDERGQVTLAVSQYLGKTTVLGRVAAAHSIDSPLMQPATVFLASMETDVRVSTVVSVAGGVVFNWQEQRSVGTFSGGYVFAAVIFRAPEIRF